MVGKTTARKAVLTAPLSVSFTAAERGRVRRAAYLSEQSVSAFIREAAVKASDRFLKKLEADTQLPALEDVAAA